MRRSKYGQSSFIITLINMPFSILVTNSGMLGAVCQANQHVHHNRSNSVDDADNYHASLFNNFELRCLNP